MNNPMLCACAVVLAALSVASAQTKTTMSGKCGKAAFQQSIPVGDELGHAYSVAQGKCSAMQELNGMSAKEGSYSEHADVTTTQMKNWGVYIESFDNGDKILYSYQGMGSMKDGAFDAGTNKYQIISGTGKLSGIKGSGTCKLTGNSDGGLDYSCTGTYSLGEAPAKPY